MPPPSPSPSASSSGRPQMTQRLPNAARASTAASQARASTPKSHASSNAAASKSGKVSGSSDRASIGRTSRTSTRRDSTASAVLKERRYSKDGTMQRRVREIKVLSDFQVGDVIGRGASGIVYRALNWTNGETVAIKTVALKDLPKAELTTIMQEIDLLKNLIHPNIVKYYGSHRDKDSLYIVLEYCENGSLYNIIQRFGKFPETLVSLYTQQVLQGLLFLHEQGVIHRDVKGANILTTKEGLVKLADFGVATRNDGLAEGSVVGTPYWMAPEIIELSGATTASDIWSLGCTVIELLTGSPPYRNFDAMPALFRIVNDDHPPLPENVSPLMRDFLMQCFQKDPNLRVSAKKLLKHPWIVPPKKAHAKKPTVYEEAVKTVKLWNAELKTRESESPNAHAGNVVPRRGSARPGSRPDSRAAPKVSTRPVTPALQSNGSPAPIARAAQNYQPAPSRDRKENYDEDFESLATSLDGLRIPDHLKPQDNFGGLFSSEKLKQYASIDSIPGAELEVESWDEGDFEGDLTVRSPLQLDKGNALETARPFYPPNATLDEIKHQPPSNLARRPSTKDNHGRKPSNDSRPKTQILRPTNQTAAPTAQLAPPIAPIRRVQPAVPTMDMYAEDDQPDYSDLVPVDDDVFQMKLKKFTGASPKRPFDSVSQPQPGGGVRRRTRTPTNLVHDAAAMRRSRSSLEIQKYADDEADGDLTDIVGLDGSALSSLRPMKTRSPKTTSATSGSTEGSEVGSLKAGWSSSWIGDEEDDEDPFAALEEELDSVDLEENAARETYARLCQGVEGIVAQIKRNLPDDFLCEIADRLLEILAETPDVKEVIVTSHGMLPILEILDTCTRPHIILRLLRIVNAIIGPSNVEMQENLCFIGGIPIISKYAHKKYSPEIRLEAAAFVRMMYLTSTLTLQMFVSCGGLNVLAEFLEEEYESEVGRELVLSGVNGIWSVFELQGPTPKNDFCRIFSRNSVLYPLSLVLNRVLDEEGEEAEGIEGRIVNIFLLFSQAENHVKESVADRMVLKTVLKDLERMRPQHQLTMLKFIKNLSMLTTTLEALQNSNAIEFLTILLRENMDSFHFREISNQVLNTMYNLCRVDHKRQEDAAICGLIPLLQRIVRTERPLKEFALPILCEMAHSGRLGRKILWQNGGLEFYVSLLLDEYWAVTALESILVWLQEETATVEKHLLSASFGFTDAVMTCFHGTFPGSIPGKTNHEVFENFMEPLQKLLRISAPIAASLENKSLFQISAHKLHTKKPLVRLNILRVIKSICDASEEKGGLLGKYGIIDALQDLARQDPAILVREMAGDLVKSSEASATPAARLAAIRRSSSSQMTPPLPLIPSGANTPIERTSSKSDYFDLGLEPSRSRQIPGSPYRPSTEDLSSSGSHLNGTASQSRMANVKNVRMPIRQPISRAHSRLSLAPSNMSSSSGASASTNENSTPTHAPPSANTRSNVAAANARRRRQTSGAELGGH